MIQIKIGGEKMAAYPKPKLEPPPGIKKETVEKMRRFLFEEVLVNGKCRAELDDRQLFGVDHTCLVVEFHLGKKTFEDIQGDDDKGDRAGFSPEQIGALNFVILEEKQKGQLETLLTKLEGKTAKTQN